ncbi:MAG TPA: kanamycin nucleotidyltransferase C-terminal domain-containing protein [Candidatus Saccharimonadales bacterium]|nr:kanamycin nucleotidyltransferase C-terminal domain-containing protein [Candidatus Saccharimonadales bacterium]
MNYPINHTHEERVNLSKNLVVRLQEKYGSDLLAVAHFGSMSRDEDMDYSDVDMIAVVKGEKIIDDIEGVQNGLSYGIDIFSQDIITSKITSVNMRWPILVGKFVTAKPLKDEQHLFDTYKQLYEETIRQDFKPYIRHIFLQEIYEECNKFVNTAQFGTRKQVLYIANRLFTKMITFLGVVNKSYYLSAASFPGKAMSLPINFPSFKLLGESVISDLNLPTPELQVVVEKMLNEIIQYLIEQGIAFED